MRFDPQPSGAFIKSFCYLASAWGCFSDVTSPREYFLYSQFFYIVNSLVTRNLFHNIQNCLDPPSCFNDIQEETVDLNI